MKIIEALMRSNITPIARMGAPVRSAASRAADVIQTPDSIVGLLGSAGNWTSGLTSALKSGLGFYGAMQDTRNQQAYNDYLAEQAEQDRQDKLAQQAWEQDYKERAFAQDLEKAQLSIDAANRRAEIDRAYALQDAEQKRKQAIEDRDAQYQHEQSIYDRNRADQLKDALDAEQRKQGYALSLEEQKRQNDIADMVAKGLRPEEAQKYLNNPQAYEVKSRTIINPARWFGAKNTIKPSKQFSNVSNEDLLKGL